ncbi:MAG: hypothetical protein RLZZ224_1686 [Verrucomicrobiota bacterium]
MGKKKKGCRFPVSRILSRKRGASLDDHFSSHLRGTPLARSATITRRSKRVALPCSVLHHVGFALPPQLPSARWALTPPFQPYLIPANKTIGGIFSAALSIEESSRIPRPHFSRGTLPYGVRTFLNRACARLRSSRKRRDQCTTIHPRTREKNRKPCGARKIKHGDTDK